jgi:hypothetical protein
MSAVILMEACPHTDHLQWDAVEQGRRCAGVPERMDCHAGHPAFFAALLTVLSRFWGSTGAPLAVVKTNGESSQRLPGSSRSAA